MDPLPPNGAKCCFACVRALLGPFPVVIHLLCVRSFAAYCAPHYGYMAQAVYFHIILLLITRVGLYHTVRRVTVSIYIILYVHDASSRPNCTNVHMPEWNH